MKAPTNKDKLGFGLDGLEVATFFAGLLVVIGLLMESGPEAWTSAINRMWPRREITGNVLVTIGVFAEVSIGIFIARSSKRAQLRAEKEIAELTERSTKAEQAAAEANLASRKLEAMMVDRKLSNPVGFIEAMRAFSGTEVIFAVGDDSESRRLLSRLEVDLTAAGWMISAIRQRRLTLPDCVMVSLPANEWYRYSPLRNAAVALGDWLNADGIITAPEFRDVTDFNGIVINVGARPSTLTAFEALQNGWRWTLDQLRMQ